MLAANRHAIESAKNAIRNPYAWPGGYARVVVMADGELLCLKCAKAQFRLIVDACRRNDRTGGWLPLGSEVYWEGRTERCLHCNAEIESEYGDPDSEAIAAL